MDFLRPASREEALAAKAEHPTAVPIAGGTDVMVEIDFGHRRPEYPLDPNRVGGPHEWETGERSVRRGARVPYGAITRSLRAELPGPALASHTSAARGTRLITVDASRPGVKRNARGPDRPIPAVLDTPAIPVDALELADEHARYGPRGAGEAPTPSSAPAVLAAIRDTTGLQFVRTPVRPEHLTGTA
ncbi:hypothetical protein SUDANB178_01643 [Streptomyces sp. enrichment culture]